jgi:hypothetical protein
MTTGTNAQDLTRAELDAAIAAIERERPHWHTWVGVQGTLYGRRMLSSPPRLVRAATPPELLAAIIKSDDDHEEPRPGWTVAEAREAGG